VVGRSTSEPLREWLASNKNAAYLLRGAKLREVEARSAGRSALTSEETAFLSASNQREKRWGQFIEDVATMLFVLLSGTVVLSCWLRHALKLSDHAAFEGAPVPPAAAPGTAPSPPTDVVPTGAAPFTSP